MRHDTAGILLGTLRTQQPSTLEKRSERNMTDDRKDTWIPGPNSFDLRAWVASLPRYGWTADMVRQLPEQFRFEVIDGELLMPDEVWEFQRRGQ